MTLVYAKIIGMFVCGAEPGGRGWGCVGVFMKSLQKSIVHIYSSLICLGGHPYVRHDVTHARNMWDPLKLGNLSFLSIFVTSTGQIPLFHEYFIHPAPSKINKNLIFLHISI